MQHRGREPTVRSQQAAAGRVLAGTPRHTPHYQSGVHACSSLTGREHPNSRTQHVYCLALQICCAAVLVHLCETCLDRKLASTSAARTLPASPATAAAVTAAKRSDARGPSAAAAISSPHTASLTSRRPSVSYSLVRSLHSHAHTRAQSVRCERGMGRGLASGASAHRWNQGASNTSHGPARLQAGPATTPSQQSKRKQGGLRRRVCGGAWQVAACRAPAVPALSRSGACMQSAGPVPVPAKHPPDNALDVCLCQAVEEAPHATLHPGRRLVASAASSSLGRSPRRGRHVASRRRRRLLRLLPSSALIAVAGPIPIIP